MGTKSKKGKLASFTDIYILIYQQRESVLLPQILLSFMALEFWPHRGEKWS